MKSANRIMTAMCVGFMLHGNASLAQNFDGVESAADYRPIGALVFRPIDGNANSIDYAPMYVGYQIFTSDLQSALLGNNPGVVDEYAALLGVSNTDVERVYASLTELNTRLAGLRRTLVEQECRPLLAGETLTDAAAKEAVARINSDEPRDEVLRDVLQDINSNFGEETMMRLQYKINEITTSMERRTTFVPGSIQLSKSDFRAYLAGLCASL